MALNAMIDKGTYDGLAASEGGKAIQANYKAAEGQQGMYVLDVTAVSGVGLENVEGLKSALSKERTNVTTLGQQLKAFEGLDAKAARDAIEQLKKIGTGEGTEQVKAKIEAITKQLEEKHTKELGEKEGQVSTLLGQLRSALIDQQATRAITEAGGNIKLLLPLVRAVVDLQDENVGGKNQKVVRVLSPDGHVRISTKSGNTGPMSIDELVAEMKMDKTLAGAFMGSGNTGSHTGNGTPGSGRESGNCIVLTSAEAKDPARYRAAKAEAEKQHKQLKISDDKE